MSKIIKIICGVLFAVTIAVVGAININFSANSNNMSEMLLANTEALAQNEVKYGTKCIVFHGYDCVLLTYCPELTAGPCPYGDGGFHYFSDHIPSDY